MSDDKDADVAIAYLKSKCFVEGISAISFDDGMMIMISKEMLDSLSRQVEEKQTNEAIVYIKHGGKLSAN